MLISCHGARFFYDAAIPLLHKCCLYVDVFFVIIQQNHSVEKAVHVNGAPGRAPKRFAAHKPGVVVVLQPIKRK